MAFHFLSVCFPPSPPASSSVGPGFSPTAVQTSCRSAYWLVALEALHEAGANCVGQSLVIAGTNCLEQSRRGSISRSQGRQLQSFWSHLTLLWRIQYGGCRHEANLVDYLTGSQFLLKAARMARESITAANERIKSTRSCRVAYSQNKLPECLP